MNIINVSVVIIEKKNNLKQLKHKINEIPIKLTRYI